MMRRRYSLHVIQPTGRPRPLKDGKANQYQAIDAAEDKGRTTGLEVRVWDTKQGKVIYTVPAVEDSHAANR